jgi:hypothetical protein
VDATTQKLVARVATLPASPQDGDVIEYATAAMAAKLVAWRLRYRASAPAGKRWEYLGGAEMYGENTGGHVLLNSVGAWTDPASVGLDCSIAVPLAGDYVVSHRAYHYVAQASGISSGWAGTLSLGIAPAGSAPAEANMCECSFGLPAVSGNYGESCASFVVAENLSVATYGQRYYRYMRDTEAPYVTHEIRARRMGLRPIRVG